MVATGDRNNIRSSELWKDSSAVTHSQLSSSSSAVGRSTSVPSDALVHRIPVLSSTSTGFITEQTNYPLPLQRTADFSVPNGIIKHKFLM